MTTKKTTKKRKGWDLINSGVPYSEMTDEEIEEVIEIKAEIIARQKAYTERQEMFKNMTIESMEYSKKINDNMKSQFDKTIQDLKDNAFKINENFEKQLKKVW